MRYLADTHALLWWMNDDPHLSRAARVAIAGEENHVFVSAASAWEITTKHRLGKLLDATLIGADVEAAVRRERFIPLPITMPHAELSGRLEGQHRDPFDRMLIAQALLEGLTLVSNETAFDAFGVARLW